MANVTPVYWLVGALTGPVLRLAYRLKSTGAENLPAAGGFVIAANHNSNLDPWPLGLPLWPHRQLFFMGKAELFNPILAPLLRAGGAFPVRRGEGDVQAIETAIRLCREGKAVAMFPEGTRQTKGLVKRVEHRPRTGAARIALEAEVPLVPAAIKGTDRLSRFPQLRVAYGPPLDLTDLDSLSVREVAQLATERLIERIYELRATL